MRTKPNPGSRKLLLILILLIGVFSASALTFGDSILPLGLVREGSFFGNFSDPATTAIAVSDGPQVRTDKLDYVPGEVVQISGSGFAPNEPVTLLIVHIEEGSSLFAASSESLTGYDHEGHEPWQVMVREDGTFSSSWLVQEDSINQTLLLTADQPANDIHNALHAEFIFTDKVAVDFKQCANNDGNPKVLGNCSWINSIVQSSNARYYEGMSNMQRIILIDIDPTTNNDHSMTLSHQSTKGGIHAYDFLTSYEQAIKAADDADVPFIGTKAYTPLGDESMSLNLTLTDAHACGPNIGPPNTLGATCQALRSGANKANVMLPDDNYVDSQDGSTLQRILAYEAIYGNRYLRIYANAPINSASMTIVNHSGSDTSDSDVNYLLSWNSTATQVLVEVAGHLAVTGLDSNGVNWGPGQGSSQINGGPYHFNLKLLDGESLGSQDNQIKGADILLPGGSIVIIKDALPNDPQDFAFTTTGTGLSNFSLDDDGDSQNGLDSTITFSGLAPGAYTVSETLGVPNWTLTNLVCTDPTSNTTINPGTGTASINLAPGEQVTCTFTNTNDDLLNGRIIVVKQTTPDGDPQVFDFNASWDAGANPDFSLSDGQQNDSCDGGPNCLTPGSYSVEEVVPADWELTGATCDDGSAINAIDLAAGETVTCTFNNTKLTADIEVTKSVDIDEICIGSDTQVTYTYQVSNNGTAGFSTVTIDDDNGTPGDDSDDFVPVFQSGDDGDSILEPGETWTYTADRTVSDTKTNTVTVTGTTAGGQEDSDTATATVTGYVCTITVTKEPDNTAVCNGSTVGYTITVTNNSPQFAWTGDVVDDVLGTLATDVTIPANGSAVYTPAHAINGQVTNTATATGAFGDTAATAASSSDNATVTGYVCTITVVKTARQTEICTGGTVTFDITVTNNSTFFTWTGNLVDDNGTPGDTSDDVVVDDSITLAPGANASYVTNATLNVDTTNTATATGTFGDVDATAASHSDYEFIDTHPCGITVTKSADADTICSGTSTTYDFSITNNSDQFTWTGTFSDDVLGDIGTQPLVLAPGQTATFDDVAGPVLTQNTTNTVTGDGTFDDPATTSASATASDTVNVSDCTISVTKTASAANVCNGATVTYDYSITNNSNAFTWTGTFVDNVIGSIGAQPLVLAPGATANFDDVPWVINGLVNNTVTGNGVFDDGSASTASDSASASVAGNVCKIRVEKETLPDGAEGTFAFSGDLADSIGDGGFIEANVLAPGQYSTTETVPVGWDLIDVTCVGDDNPDTDDSATALFDLDIGESITCTFTNRKRGTAKVVKTVAGGEIPLEDPPLEFEFQIRQGASPAEAGTVLESLTAEAGSGTLEFTTLLVPGETYQLCEVVLPGWTTSLGTYGTVFVPDSDEMSFDNSINCVNFTVEPGELKTFNIDNDPPPDGDARTIGYWKNWTSCDGAGRQDPVLDFVLASFGGPSVDTADTPSDPNDIPGYPGPYTGVWLGLPGDGLLINNCLDAVSILDKRSIDRTGKKDRGKKAANDPAFNMAAQLLAAKLNLQAGASEPICLDAIIAEADQLLADVNFNGIEPPNYGPGSTGTARKARMNYLAGLLDDYNNNELDCADYVPLP